MADSESQGNSTDKPATFLLPEEKTKHSIRVSVWEQLEKANLINFPRPCWGRIPNFKGCEQASTKVVELDEFKAAKVIKVNPDKPQEGVRASVLEHHKSLLVPIPRLREGLLSLVVLENGVTNNYKAVVQRRGIVEHGKPIDLDSKIQIDLVVIGSVAVSKDGYRIGKGEGFADLEFAMLMHMKAVNQNTIVITTVHDNQVFETLPKELFKPHDVPVDIIVTPTEVFHVTNRLPKPTGVIWNILSQRRLNLMPVLEKLRKIDEADGKDVTLRDEDSDDETQRLYKPRYHKKNFKRFPRHHRGAEKSDSRSQDENKEMSRPPARRNRFKPRGMKKNESGDTNNENPNKEVVVRFELPEKKTKKSIKTHVLKYFQKAKLRNVPRPQFYIPNFEGREMASEKLVELDEFKEAKVIQVCHDTPQEPVRIAVLKNKKKLLVPILRTRKSLINWVSVPDDATPEDYKSAVERTSIIKNGVPLEIDSEVKIDMIVVGSSIVSKDGHRMDQEKSFVDLQIAMMMHKNFIDQNTLIVTTVHDNQVFESLPKEIFLPQDIPVDIIVTPTQVIRVADRLPKPTGIIWNILSQHRLARIPFLQKLREIDEKAGKDVTLREVDSDSEAHVRNGKVRNHGNPRGRRSEHTGTSRMKQDGSGEPAESGGSYYNETDLVKPFKRILSTNGRYSRSTIAFSIRISNILPNVRMGWLKSQLGRVGIGGYDISWRGPRGYCILHFGEWVIKSYEKNIKEENPEITQVDASNVQEFILKRLAQVILSANEEPLKIEVVSRFETTDITTV